MLLARKTHSNGKSGYLSLSCSLSFAKGKVSEIKGNVEMVGLYRFKSMQISYSPVVVSDAQMQWQ